MGSRRTPGLNTISQALDLKQQGLDLDFKQGQRDATTRASELFKEGDSKGALAEIIKSGPAGLQSVTNLLSSLEQTDPARQGEQARQKTGGALRGKFEVRQEFGLDLEETKDSGPLRPGAVKALSDIFGNKDRFERLMGTTLKLLKNDVFGPLKGTDKTIREFFRVGNPDVAVFISTTKEMILNLSREANGGRPSDKDVDFVKRILPSIQDFPEVALKRIINILATNRATIIRRTLTQWEGQDASGKLKVEAIAKRNGLDLKKALIAQEESDLGTTDLITAMERKIEKELPEFAQDLMGFTKRDADLTISPAAWEDLSRSKRQRFLDKMTDPQKRALSKAVGEFNAAQFKKSEGL